MSTCTTDPDDISKTIPQPSKADLHTVLSELLMDETFSDITLISSDGVHHPALRALLASRSFYFRNLLFGDFVESRKSDINLDFPSSTLRDILTYIYTDTCPSLTLPEDDEHEPLDPLVSSRRLVDLVIAADYLAIPALSSEANDALIELLRTSPDVACMVIQLTPPTLKVHQKARSIIRFMPKDALGVLGNRTGEASHDGVAGLSEDRLAEILNDGDVFASESYLFQVLKFWAFHDGSEMRKEQARGLSRFINLGSCKPTFLREFVRPSGLVTEERLMGTFEEQAVEAERGGTLFRNRRGRSMFNNGTRILEAPKTCYENHTLGPWLTDGTHEWTFRVHKVSQCLWFGFATARPVHKCSFFEMENPGWAFSADGSIRPQQRISYRRKLQSVPISEGDDIKIELNLTGTGSVTVFYLNSNEYVDMFSGLREKAERLILALCVLAPAKIELVEEEHHFK